MRNLCVSMLAASMLLGCTPNSDDPASAGQAGADAAAGLTENDRWLAEKHYQDQTCAMCHGPSGEGGELGPALNELIPYWNETRLATYLQDPVAFAEANPDFDARRDEKYSMEMPAFANLDDADRRLLARWLLER